MAQHDLVGQVNYDADGDGTVTKLEVAAADENLGKLRQRAVELMKRSVGLRRWVWCSWKRPPCHPGRYLPSLLSGVHRLFIKHMRYPAACVTMNDSMSL